jgi:AsmA protein
MNKPLKYGLLGLGTLVVVAVAGAVVFAMTFDPNRYKADIERLAQEKTGRTLAIKGPIKLAFWPSLGADVSGVTFSEKASKEQFVAFDSAHASVKLLPLLSGQYIVDSVSLAGLKARIVKGKDGRFNFSDLVEADAKKPAAEPKKSPEEKTGPVVFDVGSISIERSSISYIDLQAGQEYALEDVKLKTGRIAQNAEGKLELAMVAKRKSPPLQAKLSADGKYQLKGGVLSGDVTAKLDDSTIKAKFTASEPYEFDASIDKINLDRYLGAPEKPAAQPQKQETAKGKQEDTPVDLSALKGINAKGKLQIGALEVRGLKLADVNAQLNAVNGRVAVAPHSAKLYEGTMSGEVTVDANRNQIALKEQLQNVAVGPILRDFAAQDRLEGKGDISLDVTTAGASVNAMKRALAGTAKVHLRDGAIKGINLGEIIRKGRTMLGGGGGSQSAAQGQSAGDKTQKTDFSELSASFTIRNGVAHNEDLDAKSPLFRLSGAGDINIGASSLEYLAKAAIVATSQGQGGKERDQLAGLTVPVRLSGTFDDLKYDVDYRAMAGAAAKSQAGEKIKERLGEGLKDEKIQERLKGLLGR